MPRGVVVRKDLKFPTTARLHSTHFPAFRAGFLIRYSPLFYKFLLRDIRLSNGLYRFRKQKKQA